MLVSGTFFVRNAKIVVISICLKHLRYVMRNKPAKADTGMVVS